MSRILLIVLALVSVCAPSARADEMAVDTDLVVRAATFPDDIDCGLHVQMVCDFYATGEVVYSGSWTGHGYWVARVPLPAQMGMSGEDYTYDGWATFTGSIAGCGRGSMRLVMSHGTVSGHTPPALGYDLDDRWEIVPGEGTGDLASVTGSGTGHFEGNEPAGNSSYVGTRTGTLRCER
jgi:hypothetical protein